jgi:YjbE family integral membrane protein
MTGAEFWAALGAIVVIDLVLAGDNAIVIALAARNLPERLRRRAIVWGTLGAVLVRIGMTACVLWLLEIPGLRLAGGVLLVCIAWRLLAPEEKPEGREIAPAKGFWDAMRTIVVADAVMGLDNVLGVAGAAHGSLPLVALGLAISVPIVVWGSTVILRWLERFPALLYVGGGVLAWTAAQMLLGEPKIADAMAERAGLSALLQAAIVAGVLGLAWLRNRRAPALKEKLE